MRVCWNW